MRSIQSRNRNLGIQNARKSAKTIVRNDSDRPALFAILGALYASAQGLWQSMRFALRHWSSPTTCVAKTRVTGGACRAVALQRSGRHEAMCRLAAR
jgi:hypothetical protein